MRVGENVQVTSHWKMLPLCAEVLDAIICDKSRSQKINQNKSLEFYSLIVNQDDLELF